MIRRQIDCGLVGNNHDGETVIMLNQSDLLEIISGRQSGIFAGVIRMGLGCLTPIYRIAIWIRNRRFDKAIKNENAEIVKKTSIPVISVGNLTTGGTGKTPMVIWIARYLRSKNVRVCLISRGYGAKQGRNDEALELEHRLPDVPHLQAPDRFEMAQIAVEELESEMILLDDGFQHRQLHRDLDIVLIDATCPFGYGRLLPRGLLREPIGSLKRADLIVITRTELVGSEKLQTIKQTIKTHVGEQPIAFLKTIHRSLLQYDGRETTVQSIANQKIFLFCGIGNPSNLKSTLQNHDLNVVGHRTFPDHHNYTRQDIVEIGHQAIQTSADVIVCTHKDLVKIETNQLEGIPIYAWLIDVEISSGQTEVQSAIDQILAAAGQQVA